jgi:hypothetical protein
MQAHSMTNQKPKALTLALVGIAFLLMVISSMAGILREDGGRARPFTTIHGEQVTLYGGEGVYRNDTLVKAVTFRGTDWANMLVGVPIMILGIVLYARGRPLGALMLAAFLTYLAYFYLIGVMGNAFNEYFCCGRRCIPSAFLAFYPS